MSVTEKGGARAVVADLLRKILRPLPRCHQGEVDAIRLEVESAPRLRHPPDGILHAERAGIRIDRGPEPLAEGREDELARVPSRENDEFTFDGCGHGR